MFPQKKNKELTKENNILKQQVQSQQNEIGLLKKDLHLKEVLLRVSDNSKNTAMEVLEEVRAGLERNNKNITKLLVQLEEPLTKEVNFPLSERAESLNSNMPPSASEGSYHYDSNESNCGSITIRSDETVIVNDKMLEQASVDGLQREAEQSPDVQLTSDEQSDEPSEVATQSDTNSRVHFTRPVQVKSPSGSELSDAEVLKSRSSRHTKELVAQELGVLKEPSTSAGCETKDRKRKPDECEFMLKFKQVTGKSRPP